ncbi:SPOR domain-containing protein [Agrococcus sp. HG114]|uniref:SPOR domain-containing protein n=1 Tax=Agrococcus sp. HG114 TaxID=2969757 RepID=UPI00215AA73B|nr:SPOR domain-containing protein [Agrococcus sp. HG114]MCR8671119.1 SPOR domain-containing protein [Agrococcus sp. HG114]
MAEFWYNLETGVVEEGMVSPGYDRAGPFSTREEAARAPEIIKERSRAWAAEEAAADDWGQRRSDDAPAPDAHDDGR